jgi:hypothetical protein
MGRGKFKAGCAARVATLLAALAFSALAAEERVTLNFANSEIEAVCAPSRSSPARRSSSIRA